MKSYLKFVALLFAAAALSGCSVDNPSPQDEARIPEKDVYAIVPNVIPFDDDDATKALTTEFSFRWSSTDRLDVYASTAGEKMIYRVREYDNDTRRCVFSILNFNLNDGTYYSMIPSQGLEDDPEAIPVTILGQKQSANDNTAHLTAYDYCLSATTITNNQGGFSFSHKVGFVKSILTLPEACTAKSVTLVSGENAFVTKGTFNVTTGVLTPTEYASSITLELDDIEVAQNGVLTAYTALFPISSTELTILVDAEKDGVPVRYSASAASIGGMPAGKFAKRTLNLVPDGAVAKIGDTFYSSLESAFYDVADDQTITLISDIQMEADCYSHASNVTLDLAGYTVSEDAVVICVMEGSLKIKSSVEGGVIRQEAYDNVICMVDSGNLTLESGSLVGREGSGYPVVTFNYLAYGTFTVTGGAVVCRSGYKPTAIFANPTSSATVIVRNTGEDHPYFVGNMSNMKTYDIAGGVYTSNDIPFCSEYILQSYNETKTIDGIGYTFNYEAVKVDVAQIGATTYGTLEEAFAAVSAGGTITLLKDYTLKDDISVSKNVTLDLGGFTLYSAGEGKRIHHDDAMAILTVMNGTVTSSVNTANTIELSDGVLLLDDVTVTTALEQTDITATYVPLHVTGGRAIINSSSTLVGGGVHGALHIENAGVVNLFGTLRLAHSISEAGIQQCVAYIAGNSDNDGGVLNVLSGARILGDAENGATHGISVKFATVNVESGSTVSVTKSAVRADSNSIVNISGGLFTGTAPNFSLIYLSHTTATVTVTDGYFYSVGEAFGVIPSGVYNNHLIVYGGKFRSDVSSFMASTSLSYECVENNDSFGGYGFFYKVQPKYGGNGSAGNYDNGDDNTNGGIIL